LHSFLSYSFFSYASPGRRHDRLRQTDGTGGDEFHCDGGSAISRLVSAAIPGSLPQACERNSSERSAECLAAQLFCAGLRCGWIDILDATAEAKQLLFLRSTHTQLSAELADCRQRIFAARSGEEFAVKLELRAWAIDLAVRCAHAAVTASSGAANQSHHAAQRVYREALAFTVSAKQQQ
jgi:hypothetical protein